ncbi:MAG TPA: S8 family serine peptidase, partial [Acidobacteriota bacterium]|nr:S8 family serine peptidase [Acidobacteriota bacterium]
MNFKSPSFLVTASSLLICIFLHAFVSQDQSTYPYASLEGPAPVDVLVRRVLPGASDLQLIVVLNEPSLVESLRATQGSVPAATNNGVTEITRLNLTSPRAATYRERIRKEQSAVRQRLEALEGVQVRGSVDTVMDALIARVPVGMYSAVRKLPGVKKLYFSRPQRMTLDAAAEVHNAQAAWEKAGGSARAGAGVKIGIIDSGIDMTNPMFVDPSLTLPPGYPKGDAKFTSNKIIAARSFTSLLARSQVVDTPIDEIGHGSFVAGCAAGRKVDAPLASIQGMAPGAFLGNYKVFGTPELNETTTSAAVVGAVNSAVDDGMDVLNLSLGSSDYQNPSENPVVEALNKAIAAGVVVVVAAGNSGPEPFTISDVGSVPDAITVGAVTNGRAFVSYLHATGPGPVPSELSNIPYIPAGGAVIPNPIALHVVDVASLDGTGLACSPLPSGKFGSAGIALIVGGDCSYTSKVMNAANAGATCAIVYSGAGHTDPIAIGAAYPFSIPAVVISNTDGLALKGFVSANAASASVQIDPSINSVPRAATPRVLADFSSNGPGIAFNLKPDLVAAGDTIYSAAQKSDPRGALYSATQFTNARGTSFSAPMVAGAAAVLKQLFPDLSAPGIKSALTTAASQSITPDGTLSPSILQTGGGLLDMGKATLIGAVMIPSNLSFGVTGYSGSIALSKSLLITNVSPSSDQFTLAVEPLVAGPTILVNKSTTGWIAPGGSETVEISLQAAAPLTGGFQGFVSVQSAKSSLKYHVPYWAGIYVPDGSGVLTVMKMAAGTGGIFRTLEQAVAQARPGNTIEIADSEQYTAGLTLATNAEGLP